MDEVLFSIGDTPSSFLNKCIYIFRKYINLCYFAVDASHTFRQRTYRTPFHGVQLLRLVYRDHSIVAELLKPSWIALDPVTWEVVLVARAGSRLVIQSCSRLLYSVFSCQYRRR